ncbi:MAG: cyclic beta 1-2 glucan synthetase, partial [Polaromonas sp.]
MPLVKLLSNGNYHVMLTSAGSGYSRWKGLAVTRWHEDAVLDNWGSFCYLRDGATGSVWSSTLQPTARRPDSYQASFDIGSASFLRQDDGIETHTEVAVSMDDDVELRRLRITNLSQQRRSLSATSFTEIVLAAAATDSAHPAFSKLFVETTIDSDLHAILATRRPSAHDEETSWFFHLALIPDLEGADVSYETDRMRFIGRGRCTVDPLALQSDAPLSGSAGPVLDAVAAIRIPFTLEAGASLTIDWLTGIATSRDDCVALARKYQNAREPQRILDQAAKYRQAIVQRLQASESNVLLYERLAASIIYADAAWRADGGVIQQNRRGQPGLWGFAVSGDLPVVLLKLSLPSASSMQFNLLHQMVQTHAYWSAFGIKTELVVVVASADEQDTTLVESVKQVIASGLAVECLGKPGGIFVLDNGKLDDGDRILLQSVSRLIVSDTAGTLAQQLDQSDRAAKVAVAVAVAARMPKPTVMAGNSHEGALIPNPQSRPPPDDLLAFNGWGGFSQDTREYVITAWAAQMTPAPWVNVLANPDFGTLVSESGSATTWSENAHEYRLTPWSNDPVSDANTEALYIRDEASGRFWSPTLLPTRSKAKYVTRHGFGYSVFEHVEDGIESALSIYVAIDAPIKFSVLKLRNRSDLPRRLSVTGYLDWVLGDERATTLMHVVTEIDTETGALFARNAYNTDFSGRTAFFDVDGSADTVCGDRGDFFGPCGTLAAPASLVQKQLSGRVGAALDPCAALRVAFELQAGEQREIIFRLGVGKSRDEACDLVRRWRGHDTAQAALEAVHQYWQTTLGVVQVQTPDATLNALTNGWLIYQ